MLLLNKLSVQQCIQLIKPLIDSTGQVSREELQANYQTAGCDTSVILKKVDSGKRKGGNFLILKLTPLKNSGRDEKI